MSLLLKLVGVCLKTTFGLSVMRDKYLRRKEKLWQPILVLIAIFAGFSVFAYFFVKAAQALVQVGNAYGQPELVYTIAIIVTQLLLLIMGLFLVISAFYFSDDLSILVPLPIRPPFILTAKLVVVVVNEYLTSLFVFVPATIAYVQVLGGGVAHFLTLAIVFLLTPVLPLVISALAALGLMRLINRRHRDLMMVIASLVFTVIILGLNFALQSSVGNNDPQAYLRQLMTSRYGLIEAIGNRFPPAVWATVAIAQAGSFDGLLNLVYFVGITAVGLVLLWWIAGRLFFAGLIGGDEVARRRKKYSQREWKDRTESGSVFSALFWREWKLFIRTPIFAMNGFLGALIMPIAMIFPLMAQGQLGKLTAALQTDPRNAAIAVLVIAALIMFMGSINTIASTSISREGKFFYISKMIPVPAELQARAKLFHGFIGAVVSLIPVTVAYAFLAKPSLVNLLAAVLIGLAGTMMGMAFGLYVDMQFPHLKWTNPQQAVKQNFNAVAPMFLLMIVIGAAAFLGFKLFTTGMSYYLIYVLFLALFAIPAAVFYRFTIGAANRLYHRLDIQ